MTIVCPDVDLPFPPRLPNNSLSASDGREKSRRVTSSTSAGAAAQQASSRSWCLASRRQVPLAGKGVLPAWLNRAGSPERPRRWQGRHATPARLAASPRLSPTPVPQRRVLRKADRPGVLRAGSRRASGAKTPPSWRPIGQCNWAGTKFVRSRLAGNEGATTSGGA